MRRKITSAAAAAAFVVASLPAAALRAQETAPKPKPRVEVKPRIEVGGGILAPTISVAPEISIDLPDIDIQLPPMPPDAVVASTAPEAISINGSVWVGDGDVWISDEQTVREETRQTYQLSAGARVELSNINGPVRIDTGDGQTAELRVQTYSSAKEPRKLSVEHTPASLSIRGATKAERGREDWLGSTRHHVRLTLPRRVQLSLTDVTESVRVGEIEGPVQLTNVSGRVGVAQAAGSAEVTNVSGSVSLTLARVAGRGVAVKKVAGSVGLRFLEDVNADLQTSGISGKVYVEVPNVSVQGEMNKADFRAKVGAGGAPVSISDVSGSVRLAPGRTVAEMLAAFKSTDRRVFRTQSVSDLALHISNRQVRQAFVEALNSAEQNNSVQAAVARELAPYVNEPEVREAFLRALASEPGRHSDATKATAARALAAEFGDEKAVRDALLRAMTADAKGSVRMTLVNAVARHVEDPAVVRALAGVLRGEGKDRDAARVRAATALAKRTEDAEVYALLLEAARNDKHRGVRVAALNGLSRRIRERPELRELFLGYLDSESLSLQYHALRGLVELGDASLRQRLVEKGREIVVGQGRRYWNDRMVLDTILLIRRLDPQEADRLLEQLAAERTRT